MPLCARTASPRVAAEPSCRYGAVAHTSRSVGRSMPVSVAPRRLPLVDLMVPTFTSVLLPLPVNAAPAWQAPQPRLVNSVLPAAAAVDKAPVVVRNGLVENVFSDATYAA